LRWRVKRRGKAPGGLDHRRAKGDGGRRALPGRAGHLETLPRRDPIGVVDHRDRNRANNRIANLRDVSMSLNAQNRPALQRNNSSGIRGVWFNRGRWRARIGVDNQLIDLGRFDTHEEAIRAYTSASATYHPACWL
jgi:HNH endonuclease